MSNNKQSSVSSLIAEIQRRVAIIQSEPQTMARELMIDNLSVDLEQYEERHAQEIEDAYWLGLGDGQTCDGHNLDEIFEYIFKGSNEK